MKSIEVNFGRWKHQDTLLFPRPGFGKLKRGFIANALRWYVIVLWGDRKTAGEELV